MTNTFRTVLKNAFEAGNKKAIGAKPIEGALRVPYGVYCQTMLDVQANLHDYVSAQAMDDKDKTKAGKVEASRTAVYDILKKLMENVRGILCESGDLLYLQLAAYKLAKSKDVEKDDGSFIIGTKRVVPVSATSFRVIVEALLGNKIAGNTWDIAMKDFRAQTDAEKAKIQAKLDKRNASMKKKASPAKATAEKAAKAAAPAKVEKEATKQEKKPAAKAAAKKPATKRATPEKATQEKAEPKQVTMAVVANPSERRLDGTLPVKASA